MQVVEAADTDLGASSAASLTVVTTGAISTSGTLAVSGAAVFKTLDNVGESITIDDASTFGSIGAVSRNSADNDNAAGAITIAPGTSTLLNALATTGDLTLNAPVGGVLSQDGASTLAASGLQLLGGGSFNLSAGSNAITTLAGNTGNVVLREDSGFAIGTVNTIGLTATGAVTLSSTGTVTQLQGMDAAGLELLGTGGTFALTHTANAISTLAGNTGAVSFLDNSGFAIGTVNTVGLTTSADTTLSSTGAVTQSQKLVAARLELLGAAGAFTLTNAANAITTLSGNTGTISFLENSGFAIGTVNTIGLTTTGNLTLSTTGAVTQSQNVATTGLELLGASGAYALTRDTNTIPLLAGHTGAATVHTSGALVVGAVNSNGFTAATDLTLVAGAAITQTQNLAIGRHLALTTTHAAGDVTMNNSGAVATRLGNATVGGDYTLTATNGPVTQAALTSLLVVGDLTVDSPAAILDGAGNLIGGSIVLPSSTSLTIRQSGMITLGDGGNLSLNEIVTGDLTVISVASSRAFTNNIPVHGTAIDLNRAGNSVGGVISVATTTSGISSVGTAQTGIVQQAGATLTVTGVASFTAEDSPAPGSGAIDLSNSGNSFGGLRVSGSIVNVNNSDARVTDIGSAVASTSFTLTTNDAITQSGAIVTPTLDITSSGAVTLADSDNNVGTLTVDAAGRIAYTDADGFVVAGLDAGNNDVTLIAGATGDITQTGAMLNVDALTLSAGGAITLTGANTIASLAGASSGSDLQITDTAGGIAIDGPVLAISGDVTIRTSGNLTLSSGSTVEATAGDIALSAAGAGNFINSAGPGALTVGSGNRWLVYTSTPDLVPGSQMIKGGLISSFRHYGASYNTYLPAAVTESGNGFIYSTTAPTLTVGAQISGTASHIYGDTPTDTLGYTITAGFVDSEETTGNIISGGTAVFTDALSAAMDAGSYIITYTGGLTSAYTLVADANGAAYTVTPAVLNYTATPASRFYGAANPVLTGTITGFKLADTAGSVLSGTGAWITTAVSDSSVGQYSITGSGYSVGSNYTFAQAAGNATAFTITGVGLTVTANGASRDYNGTLFSGGAGVTYSGFINGDDAGDVGGTLVYGGTAQGARNAGTYAIAPSGLSAANYAINYVDGALTIDPADFTLISSDVIKDYDGTLSAAGTVVTAPGSLLFGTDTMNGGTFAFASANAGTGNRTVILSGATVNDGNSGGNYNIVYVNNTTSTINRANIAVSSSNVTKTYDGTLAALGAVTLASGTLYNNASNNNTQDSVSGGTFAFTNPNAGSGSKAVATSGVTVNDGNDGGNYQVSYVDNNTSTINPAALTFVGTIANKAYDGTTAATLSGYALTGLVDDETVNAAAGAAAFLDKNVGSGKTVALGGITLADGTNGGLAANYVVSSTAGTTGNIDPKVLTLNATVADKVYDGTTNAALDSFGIGGFVGTETVIGNYTGSASFVDKHVGTDKAIAITGIALANGANGGLASNYAVPSSAVSAADITPATLYVAGAIGMNKVYDGTVTATLNTTTAALTGVVGADQVQIGSIAATFLTKDVGADKPISTSTVVLSGADAGEYVLVQPAVLTASITPRSLNVSATAMDKVYDATAAATVSLVDDRVAGDVLAISSTQSFLDKNVATGKFVSVSGISLTGTDSGNYTANGSAGAFASITKANLSVDIIATDKVYDSTTSAAVALLVAPLSGDDVDLSFVSADFADKNAGTGKLVSVRGIIASGADAGNYSFSAMDTTTADIAAAALTVTALGGSKSYDGNSLATITLMDNRVAGDELSLLAAGATFYDSNVGDGKDIAVSGIRILGGADSGNYVLANDTAMATGDITGDVLISSTHTFSLPPILPHPMPPSVPLAPPLVLGLTQMINFGFAPGTGPGAEPDTAAGSGITGFFEGSTGDHVMVAVIRSPAADIPDVVSVMVPQQVLRSGKGFSIPLPAALAEAASTGGARMTLMDGQPLPSWLKYVPATSSFSVAPEAADALPIQVLVRVGKRRWTMLISE